MRSYKQGRFKPRNPSKYNGDPTGIIYRSSWELKVMQHFDANPDVVKWSSEEVIVPYWDESTQKQRRYFPDFIIKKKNGEVFMIEVKPYKETVAPKKPKKVTKRYLEEVMTWGKNSSKWSSAEAYCAKRGWKFVKLTEKDLGI